MISIRIYNAVTAITAGSMALFSPQRAAVYRVARDLYRTYAAGQLAGPNQNWRPRNKSADSEIRRGYVWVTARTRDQAQNNPHISGGIERIGNNVVRSGIRPQFMLRDPAGGLDLQANSAFETLFSRWAKYADLTGHDSLWALQKLILRHMWIDGQVLIHRTYDYSLPGIVPLRLELLECDHLDPIVDGPLPNGNLARRGIEFNELGRPVAYHITPFHPGDSLNINIGVTKRIPASEIIHVWDRRRVSQYSGISWLAAIVMEAYDMADYREIERLGARTAASFTAFVNSNFPDFRLGGMPAGGQTAPVVPAATSATSDKAPPTEIEPNRIQYLPGSASVTIASHNRPGSSYEPFVTDSQRAQSVGMGMSFEAFANNYSDASYASSRSGALEERLSYQGQQKFINEQVNAKLAAWFLEAAWLASMAPEMARYAADPLYYHEQISWQEPGWTWVDPRNDAQAAEKLLSLTLDTRRSLAAQRGKNFADVVESQIEEEKMLLELNELRRKNMILTGEINDPVNPPAD